MGYLVKTGKEWKSTNSINGVRMLITSIAKSKSMEIFNNDIDRLEQAFNNGQHSFNVMISNDEGSAMLIPVLKK